MGNSRIVGRHMILILDGHEVGTVAYLSGGQPVSNTFEEPVSLNLADIRHRSATDIEPFVVQVGALRPVMAWIGSTLSRQHASRTFELRQGRDGQGVSRKAFQSWLTEFTFPPLDRRSAGDAFLKLKVQPERAEYRRTNVQRRNSPPMVPLSDHAFRFTIDGALDGNEAQRVETFTIKVGTKLTSVGESRTAMILPTKVEFPNFTVHLAPTQAKRLKAWFDAAAAEADGARTTTTRKGRLELFSRGGARAMTLELAGLDIMSIEGMSGASAKVQFSCGQVSLGS